MPLRLFSFLHCALITIIGALIFTSILPAQTTESVIKIVVDASKDGGTWWFPQEKKPFDPSKPHKGKYLADYLRKLAPLMVEMTPGETLTDDQLKGVTVLVRFNAYGPPYRSEEIAAYTNYLKKGGSILLVYGAPGKGSSDAVADALGIRFGPAAQTPFIKKWAQHPITDGLKDVAFQSGSMISGYPESAIQLGMMTNGKSLFGMVTVGKGKIIYLGSIAPLLDVSQPLLDRVFGELMMK